VDVGNAAGVVEVCETSGGSGGDRIGDNWVVDVDGTKHSSFCGIVERIIGCSEVVTVAKMGGESKGKRREYGEWLTMEDCCWEYFVADIK
jgi:hypothetical protein